MKTVFSFGEAADSVADNHTKLVWIFLAHIKSCILYCHSSSGYCELAESSHPACFFEVHVFFGDKIIGTNVVWGWIGIVPLVTGLFRFCPAYLLFGIKTCPMK